MTARQTAHKILVKTENTKGYSNISLDHALESSALSAADKALTSALVYGVIERRITLDYIISKLSSRDIKSIDKETLVALRLGIYQLRFMDRIPPHAAINETVSLCSRKSTGFVNAILRAYTRLAAPVEMPSRENDTVRYLSVEYSVCEALAEKLLGIFGLERTEKLLAASFETPKTTLRVNTLKTTREELLSKIDGAEPTEISPVGLKVSGAVRELYGFEKGLFFVQDEASQICVGALDAKAGELVIDACACPGSKSFGAAIDMKNEGKVRAFDLHKSKLSLISGGAKRLGIEMIDVAEGDARHFIPELEGAADRVLCDVPCSGFGVIAKKPELRYKDPAESAPLPDIQLAILKNCSHYVKAGGVLVYSTCTIFPEENEENIKRFLESEPSFSLEGFAFGSLEQRQETLSLYPDIHHTDGFFVARMVKKK